MEITEMRKRMEAEKSKKKLFTKKRILILGIAVVILITAGGVAGYLFMRSRQAGRPMQSMPQMNAMGENVISASGLTSAGMLEETWELDFLETALYVEESYLSTGDEVVSGTAVFKVSEETLTKARKELEDKVTEADLAYRQGVIDYEGDMIDARVTDETAAVNETYAQAEYDQAAAQVAEQVESLEEQVEEARELVDEYTRSQTEDYYRSYYKVDELYQTYYEHFTLLMEYYEKWDIEENGDRYGNTTSGSGGVMNMSLTKSTASGLGQTVYSSSSGVWSLQTTVGSRDSRNTDITVLSLTSTPFGDGAGMDFSGMEGDFPEQGSGAGSPADGAQGGNGNVQNGNEEGQGGASQGGFGSFSGGGGFGVGGFYDENQSKVSVYNMLDEMVQEEGAAYKEALENYESAKEKAAAGLDAAVSNLATLEAELTQAKADYEAALISCRADYQTILAESENAEMVYEATVQSLEETLAVLEDDKEEAEENLALFEEVIGDGYFYTSHAGTIVMNGIRESSYLSGETIVVAYSNPEEVTVSANVDQSNIAQISVGDSVYVMVNEYGNYTGIVTEINPVTQAQSRSSVTYQVTVKLEGDVSALESNLTAYLYFGMTEEMLKQATEGAAGSSRPEAEGAPNENTEEAPEGMPEGMDFGDMPEMPEGMDFGDMPEGMNFGDMPEMPEGMDFGNMPRGGEGFGNGERPQREAGGSSERKGESE